MLVLLLGFGASRVRAQAQHVVPLDSTGWLNRAQAERYLHGLPGLAPEALEPMPWETVLGTPASQHLVAAFDSSVAVGMKQWHADLVHQHVLERLGEHTSLDSASLPARGLFGLSPNTADVSFDGSLQLQLSTTRSRNLKCTPAQAQDPAQACFGGFTAPRLDNVVMLQSAGVFDQRFHVNIDFESTRDYAAQNVLSLYYQGLEDEKLQRVSVGTVVFRPPPSRFLSASIPANNLGISAEAVFGPVDVQAIAATQKGSIVANKTFTIGGTGSAEPQDQIRRDLDYEPRRVFWVVNPDSVPGYPAVDVLNLGSVTLPANVQPTDVRVYRYIAANQSAGANANYEGVTAQGVNGNESVGPLRWVLLKPNVDYWIDPSQTWFMLSSAIDPNDYLAVSYRTKDGGSVGTVPSVDNPAAHDLVKPVYLPNRGPSSPVFAYEMRQFYRVAGSSLVRSSLQASILVANSERPISAPGTYLSLLGLAVPANTATLDVDNRLFPRVRDQSASTVITDAFLVFPSVQPFSNPELTPTERNDSLYVTPEYLLQTQGPPSKFQLSLQFDAQGGNESNTISLGSSQISEHSEHLQYDGVTLVNGVDYSIDYATGRVTFLNPVGLFGHNTATITASYEERGLFVQAPTSIAGLTALWTLGRNKTIGFTGLYQAEATGYTRPQIGYEPRASLLAGVTADLAWDTPGITHFVNHLINRPTTAPSQVSVSGELDMSRPDPNRSGDAYLEQFEDNHSVLLSAQQTAWKPGSVPTTSTGVQDILPQGFDSANAVALTWQNLVPNGHDSITQLSPKEIDSTIVLTKSTTQPVEPVLWLALQPDTAGGILRTTPTPFWTQPRRPMQPRWRTITTALSATGLDLSSNDYFQFALYQNSDNPIQANQMRIVIDLGKVSEDALAIAPLTFRVLSADSLVGGTLVYHRGDTTFAGRQYVGVGRLDTEKTPFGTWSATANDIGILADRPDSLVNAATGEILAFPQLCRDSLSATVVAYPWGDLGSRCSVNNGFADTEDLDGDNILNAQGPNDDVFRYVINLATDSAKYFLRSHLIVSLGDTASWTIYRVPLHMANDTIGNPDIHLIKQMRLAFVEPAASIEPSPTIRFALALMQFTGAAWIARSDRPDSTISGQTAQPHGSVLVGSVSTQDSIGLGYSSPPGVVNESADVSGQETQIAEQINETSLRIQAADIRPGERAEGYLRIPDGSKNLLAYRTLRVWVRGHGPGWDSGPLQAYAKVGSDAFNFYLYRQPAHTGSWDPEMVIDLQTWQDLRAQIENERLEGAPPTGAAACGVGDVTAYVACSPDGAYVVQVRDPLINPPNLAAVQELAAGMYYPVGPGGGAAIQQTELWVDDIRVSDPVATAGYAGAIDARLIAADVATVEASFVSRDGQFHLMGQDPSYQGTATASSTATVHVDRFLPAGFGLLIPVTVSSTQSWVNPQLIAGTDVQTGGIAGLRRPRQSTTNWTVRIADQVRKDEAPLTRLLLNPLSFTATGSTSSNLTSLTDVTANDWLAAIDYSLNLPRRTYSLGLRGLTQRLPAWLRRSLAGQALARAAFAPLPINLHLSSSLTHTMGDLTSYQLPIMQLSDTILKPVTSEQFLWNNSESFTWQPLGMLTVTHSLISVRDLRDYSDSTTLGRVVNASHRSLLGADVGVENSRSLTNGLTLTPRINSWLSPQIGFVTNFFLARSLASRNPVRVDGDTAGEYILPQTFNNSRVFTVRLVVDPRILMQRIFGDSSGIAHALVRFRPIEFTQNHVSQSTFDLATFDPSLGYQLALGSFNEFLIRNGQQALGANLSTATTATASVDLPGGLSAQSSYSATSSDQYQQKSTPGFLQTTTTATTWPKGAVSYSRTFANGPIATVSASSSVSRDLASSVSPFEEGGATRASSETDRLAPNMSLLLRNGVLFTMTGEVDHTDGSNSGNISRVDATTLSGSVQWSMRLPRALSATRRQLVTSLTYTDNTNNSCIQRTSDTTCVPYYGLSRYEIQTSFSASLNRGMRAALQVGYVHNAVETLGQLTSTVTISALLNVPLSSLGM
jgi:hypothetical protein